MTTMVVVARDQLGFGALVARVNEEERNGSGLGERSREEGKMVTVDGWIDEV